MKAIINNNITYKLTGERGDFFITEDNKGKLKMFAKNTVEVVEIESMPKAKVFKKISKSSQAVIDADFKNFNKRMAEAEYYEHKF
ncbi:hypothetical protein [Chryseobacterium indoltheticum]|uniref:Uncharacterized protein n=1 Tax=Chryseobacterium indoltheticum TaxID=254 RepID=A0A381FAK1_9FLAO|nr:hypothetical protein [Chryseobacterium indoltheticum]AZA73556.1 hypothetical protein EG358_07220 [Chryseobacterium indoltheticum]SIR24451.1 hypothetical protein SAMN05421682_11599 [Chryseobacterium indoltheticum]SUX43498.1 Uncharacterised protein [Chryseobacterium indoltheticum]